MSATQKLAIAIVILIAAVTVTLSFQNQKPEQISSAEPEAAEQTAADTISNSNTTPAIHPLLTLAQHHCGRLQPESERTACITQINQDLETGKLAPVVPEVDPLACNNISDPAKQHECHAWMGHDFAVSTGEPGKCQVIPQDTIRASCLRLIIINEIKQLYSLELNTDTSPPTHGQ